MWLVRGLEVTEGLPCGCEFRVIWFKSSRGGVGGWGGDTVRPVSAQHKVRVSNKCSCFTEEWRSLAPPPSQEAIKQS